MSASTPAAAATSSCGEAAPTQPAGEAPVAALQRRSWRQSLPGRGRASWGQRKRRSPALPSAREAEAEAVVLCPRTRRSLEDLAEDVLPTPRRTSAFLTAWTASESHPAT